MAKQTNNEDERNYRDVEVTRYAGDEGFEILIQFEGYEVNVKTGEEWDCEEGVFVADLHKDDEVLDYGILEDEVKVNE